ncbi:hypothetical protein MNBD_BACTEROID05-672 [hydrothermal vent metagenome]|uniref:Glycosyltransferase RgtA/B/C/D-like domain-containing protein n=1 Tax=hydrothermal vent metagenome TaxID=652676 RepID=A0A3B0U6P4_9ZZZZ
MINTFLLAIPFLISLVIGFNIIQIILPKKEKISFLFHFFLATGLGAGITAFVGFFCLAIFNKVHIPISIVINIIILLATTGLAFQKTKKEKIQFFDFSKKSLKPLGLLIALLILMFPSWIYANFYPFGGWDAWQVWNFKAKFLFLSGENWTNMFDPILWRSSPHYPLFLPLMNVWGWSFINEASYFTPLLTSLYFTFSLLGLLYCSIKHFSSSRLACLIILPIVFLTIFTKLTTSQYADLLVGYYLLATVVCLMLSIKKKSSSFALLGGIFNGFLAFTKGEGLLAAGILGLLSLLYFFIINKNSKSIKNFLYFAIACAAALIPSLIFYGFWAPDNVTFSNGILSQANQSSFLRFKIIWAFYFFELISGKWHGLWILLLGGMVLAHIKGFRRLNIIMPLFLLSYLGAITLYYQTNTHFEIAWWLSVTLTRVLFAILPIAVLWVSTSVWQERYKI